MSLTSNRVDGIYNNNRHEASAWFLAADALGLVRTHEDGRDMWKTVEIGGVGCVMSYEDGDACFFAGHDTCEMFFVFRELLAQSGIAFDVCLDGRSASISARMPYGRKIELSHKGTATSLMAKMVLKVAAELETTE